MIVGCRFELNHETGAPPRVILETVVDGVHRTTTIGGESLTHTIEQREATSLERRFAERVSEAWRELNAEQAAALGADQTMAVAGAGGWENAWTRHGSHLIQIDVDPYLNTTAVLKIDGKQVEITSAHRARDGGTTRLHLADGRTLVCPRALGDSDRTPRLIGG